MNVESYMKKYAKIAGLEKEAVKLRGKSGLGKRGLPAFSSRLGRKPKNTTIAKDPGYVFLNSGQFIKFMNPQLPTPIPEIELQEEPEQVVDMFGRPIGPKELYG